MFYQGRSYFNALDYSCQAHESRLSSPGHVHVGQEHGHQFSDGGWRCLRQFHFQPQLVRHEVGPGPFRFQCWPNTCYQRNVGHSTAKSLSGAARWITEGWELGTSSRSATAYRSRQRGALAMIPLLPKTMTTGLFRIGSSGSGCKSLTNPGNPNNYVKTQCFAVPTHRCCLLGCE